MVQGPIWDVDMDTETATVMCSGPGGDAPEYRPKDGYSHQVMAFELETTNYAMHLLVDGLPHECRNGMGP